MNTPKNGNTQWGGDRPAVVSERVVVGSKPDRRAGIVGGQPINTDPHGARRGSESGVGKRC